MKMVGQVTSVKTFENLVDEVQSSMPAYYKGYLQHTRLLTSLCFICMLFVCVICILFVYPGRRRLVFTVHKEE